jgi:hypothetical protein
MSDVQLLTPATLTPTPQSIDSDLLPQTILELRPYVGIADKEDVDLSSHLSRVFKQLSEVTDSLILAVIEKRTTGDFRSAAIKCFNSYVRALRMRSDFLQVILKNDLRATARLVDRSLNALEFDFKDHGTLQFGPALTEQAEFTIWTRRKTANLVWRLFDPGVLNHTPSKEAMELSKKLYSDFALAAAWSQFHLDCLTTAMRLRMAIYPDVVPAIVEGLRMEVNAYALAKQMIDLYLPPATEEQLVPYTWTEDDEELLASSMEDMESETLEGY